MGIKRILLGLFLLSIFFSIKYETSPIGSNHDSENVFLNVNTSCFSCITHEDSLLINNQKKSSKDSINIDVTYIGIERVVGIIKYEENQYKGFLDGYRAVYFYLEVGKLFFGPFGEKIITY